MRNRWLTLALWLAALALLSLVYAIASAEPYPRLGAYTGTRSNGAPLVRADGSIDSAMCAKLARFPKVVLHATTILAQPNIVATLAHYRPGIEVSAYTLVTHWYLPDSFVTSPSDKSFAAYWHNGIKGTNGFISGAPEGYVVNVGQKSTADTLASLSAWAVRRARVQGFFGDYFSPLAAWAKVGNDFTDNARVANLTRWVERLREEFGPDFRVYANGTGADKTGVDGTMREGYPGALTSFAQAMTQKAGDWLKSEHTPGTWGDPQVVRFLLGTACMTGATVTYGQQSVTVPYHAELWFPEYAVDPNGMPDPTGRYVGWLGEAIGPATKLSSGVYVRSFEHGVVLVNPTTSWVTVDMVHPRWKAIGSAVPLRVVSVRPTDAVFLWGD